MRIDFVKYCIIRSVQLPFFHKQAFCASCLFKGGHLTVPKSPICASGSTRKGMPLVLAIFWFGGLLCGVMCYCVSPTDTISLMCRTAMSPVSIVGMLNAVLIPFLLSALFTALSMTRMFIVICFLKAFLFSFVSLGILVNCGSGGWLLRYFLLFGDCTMLPLLYWYWMRAVTTPVRHRWVSCILICGVFVLATVLDYRVIAPSVRQIL